MRCYGVLLFLRILIALDSSSSSGAVDAQNENNLQNGIFFNTTTLPVPGSHNKNNNHSKKRTKTTWKEKGRSGNKSERINQLRELQEISQSAYCKQSRLSFRDVRGGTAGMAKQGPCKRQNHINKGPPIAIVSDPTISPAQKPSPAPSPTPTDSCNLEIEVDCTVPDFGGVDCDSIPALTQICEDRPSEMTFRYNGGDCSQSFNIQPRSLFTCEDFAGGNPTKPGALTFIQAFQLGGGDIYFEGLVPVGENFNLTGNIGSNMNISYWDPGDSPGPPFRTMTEEEVAAIVRPQNMLQTVKYHSSCSENLFHLFLKDRFGSAQLVQFINKDQGLITSLVNVMLDLAIGTATTTEGSQVRLLTFFSLTNQFGTANRTDEVNGMIVNSGDIVRISPIEATIDLTTRTRYTFETVIVGETLASASRCSDQYFFEFLAGNQLAPIMPAVSPTIFPSLFSPPKLNSENMVCDVMAIVECEVTDGPSDQTCETLREPSITQCRGTSITLTHLRFRYNGGLCDGFASCEDFNGGLNSMVQVFVEVSDRDGDYFSRSVAMGDFFDVTSPSGFSAGSIEINVFAYDSGTSTNRGNRLQKIEISTACEDPGSGVDAELTLGNQYGCMTLAAFETDQDGFQSKFAKLTATFTVANPSDFEASTNSAVVSSSLSGFDQQVLAQPLLLGRDGDEKVLFVETDVIDLSARAADFFILVLTIEGSPANTPAAPANGCDSTDIFTFSIEEAP